MTLKRPRILVFSEYYRPGYKSGGGMRTVANMVDRLSDRFDFRIITHDHDGNLDTAQYTTVAINEWIQDSETSVYYIARNNIRLPALRKLILSVAPDAIYTNSFFSPFTILLLQLRKLRLIPNLQIVVAPCGEISDAGLRKNIRKKELFLRFAKAVGLYKNIIWKASTDFEKAEIERIRPKGGKIFVAPDLPALHLLENYAQTEKPEKQRGEARMIFLSRFVPKKNFKWLLEQLGDNIKGRLVIHIHGPLEDPEYWTECQHIIKTLPSNIEVEAFGPLPHEAALEKMFHYHFFLLPTLGENFGHVFLEALAAGCPLVISDRTPWLSLPEKGIGWDLPLEHPQRWIKMINHSLDMDAESYSHMSAAAREYAKKWLADTAVEEATVAVLNESIGTIVTNLS